MRKKADPLLSRHCFNHGEIFYAISKRSRFITFAHAAIKSFTNLSFASSHAYNSAMALSSVLLPNIKSTRVPIHLILPVLRSVPTNASSASDTAYQVVCMSKRFTKKSFVNVSGLLVNTPFCE